MSIEQKRNYIVKKAILGRKHLRLTDKMLKKVLKVRITRSILHVPVGVRYVNHLYRGNEFIGTIYRNSAYKLIKCDLA